MKDIRSLNRRGALRALFLLLTPSPVIGAAPSVSTLIGTGSPGYSDRQVNNPYGLVIGPDRALYFCDLDNQRIRRLDPRTRRATTVAGNGQRAYRGDGGAATDASLNMPHEIQFDSARNLYVAERDNHVIRKVDAKTGLISTCAGTGVPGFSSAISAITVFGRSTFQAAGSRPMVGPANGCRRLMVRR